jgi:hypothetical protein
LGFASDKMESTQGLPLEIDLAIGLDAPHHVEKVQDHMEAVNAFMERWSPQFQGK